MHSKKQARIAPALGFSLIMASLLSACGAGGEGDGEGGGGGSLPPTTGLLQSLTIAPSSSTATACSPVQFVATGHYSDNTTLDVTNAVVWQVDPAASSVAIANEMNGQVVGINPGSATVIAWSGNISASAVLSVSGGSVTSVAVTPAVANIAVRGIQLFNATATCSTGSADISRMNVWTSDSPAVASVSTAGMATGLAAGSSVIAATAGAVAGSAVLSVQ